MRSRLPVLLFVLALAVGAAAPAQADGVPQRSFGVQRRGDQVVALGPGYSARIDRDGCAYTPLLGAAAGRPLALATTLLAVQRGDTVVFARSSPGDAPEIDGTVVRCRHAGVTEVWEVRADGIEQRFELAARPAGTGDLVVRLALATELPLAAADPRDGARFELAGTGGVSIGGVTGVDADGCTAAGELRVAGDHVDYVLPAAFVDAARYPLVVDPLIGSVFQVGNVAGGDDLLPSVAYDASNARYLVVWNVDVAIGSREIRGQFVNASGTLIGGAMLLGNGNLVPGQAVASVNGTNRFLVGFSVWNTVGGTDYTAVWVFAVDAGTGAVSNAVMLDSVVSGIYHVENLVVGGDSRPLLTQHTAMVGWRHSGGVYARAINVPLAGDPTPLGAAATYVSASQGSDLAISAHGGAPARWMLVWRHASSVATPAIGGCVLEGAANVCLAPVLIASDHCDSPVVATRDGTNFLVAWHDSTSGDEVLARTAAWSGVCGSGNLALGPVLTVPAANGGAHDRPAVAFAKDKYVLAWRDRLTPSAVPQVRAKGLDPATCVACGADWSLETGLTALIAQDTPAIGSRFEGGDTTSDEALLVWSNATIRGRRFEARGTGTATSVGGKCVAGGGGGGGGGAGNVGTYLGDPVVGNLDFQLTLSAPTVPVLAVIVGLSQAALPCGPCTLVPNLDIVMSGPGPHAIPLPCDLSYLGVQFWSQWLLWTPGGCPILADFGLSDAMQFTIGE